MGIRCFSGTETVQWLFNLYNSTIRKSLLTKLIKFIKDWMYIAALALSKWTSHNNKSSLILQNPWCRPLTASYILNVMLYGMKSKRFLRYDIITHAPMKWGKIYKMRYNPLKCFTYERAFPPDLLPEFEFSIFCLILFSFSS